MFKCLTCSRNASYKKFALLIVLRYPKLHQEVVININIFGINGTRILDITPNKEQLVFPYIMHYFVKLLMLIDCEIA